MRFKQRWAFGSVVMMLSIILAACGGTAGTGGTTASGGTTAASPSAGDVTASARSSSTTTSAGADETAPAGAGAAGGGAATTSCPDTAQGARVAMWSPLTGPDGAIMTQLTTRFNEENAQKIQVLHVPQPEYLQKLTTAAGGNTLPELTIIRASDIGEMAVRNVIKPMGNAALTILGGSNLAGEFPESIWQGGEYNGQRYAVPLDVHPLVLYYNKDMFQQAGITVPTDRPMTRQEFEAAADALNKDGVSGIAIGSLAVLFETILNQFGGSVVNEDGTQATFNSDAGVQALTYLQQIHQKYSPGLSGAGDPEVTRFQQGKAAMVIHGPWQIPNLMRLPTTGVAMVPQFGNQFAVWGNSHALALTSDDPARQAAAACWVGWLSENSSLWATAGMIPARESVRTSEELKTVAPVITIFGEEVNHVSLLPSVPGIGGAIRPEGYDRAVNAVLIDQRTDIKAVLDEAAQRSNQLLEQNRAKYRTSQ